jgi:hypothetical protein
VNALLRQVRESRAAGLRPGGARQAGVLLAGPDRLAEIPGASHGPRSPTPERRTRSSRSRRQQPAGFVAARAAHAQGRLRPADEVVPVPDAAAARADVEA